MPPPRYHSPASTTRCGFFIAWQSCKVASDPPLKGPKLRITVPSLSRTFIRVRWR